MDNKNSEITGLGAFTVLGGNPYPNLVFLKDQPITPVVQPKEEPAPPPASRLNKQKREKLVEAGLMLLCTCPKTWAAYLIEYGWRQRDIGDWIDPIAGGATGTIDSLRIQIRRVLIPHASMLKRLNNSDTTQ